MSIARGWGQDAEKHRWEDYITKVTDDMIKSLRPAKRKEKIKKILDVIYRGVESCTMLQLK